MRRVRARLSVVQRYFLIPEPALAGGTTDNLLRHPVHRQIAHWLNPEGIGHPVEEGEHRGYVNRLGDLRFRPARLPQGIGVGTRDLAGLEGDFTGELQQLAFGVAQSGRLQIAFGYGGYGFVIGSLFTQEVGMGVQSIGTAIERRDVAGDSFFLAASEMAFGKMNSIGKSNDLAQEVRPVAETLQNAGDNLASAKLAPLLVHFGGFAGGFGIFNQPDISQE
jgi:hypothetical protein